ncbi:MAG: chemotaxis protein CheA [Clostridiales bacterium]|nr:chemotaxis protein CheA [Eubacteriales bacterium]MDH7567632.1 chemotaxis protein CheA [Clostridiales bacterium]
MNGSLEKDPMLELFVFETLELISQLENIALNSEEANTIESQINEVFRIVHTIKSSAAMMNFENIASLSHSMEDVFYYIRENHPENVDYSALADIVLRSTDFIKNEVNQIQTGNNPNRDASAIVQEINEFLSFLKNENGLSNKNTSLSKKENNEVYGATGENRFKALIFFEDDCQMENIRAFNVLHNLEKAADIISYSPKDIIENQGSAEVIRKSGFDIEFSTDLCIDDVKTILSDTIFLKDLKLETISTAEIIKADHSSKEKSDSNGENSKSTIKQSMISVNVSKLDRLMDLVGELVISQAMVIQNPELEGLALNSFNKASSQLQKVTNELQDAVMSIRMVPLSVTFQKMHRIVRDMGKRLNKEVKLEIIGEETEVDKNIIEHLSDPLIHLARNAVDHGIEPAQERANKGKPTAGKITLEARNEGGDVWIIVRDDGKGLDRKSILQKARQRGILNKPENELTDREIYSYIFLPGFSTNEEVTEFSGRGVGMDVVNKNIEEIGGTVQIDSSPGIGTTISIKIPLTLAIMDGMKVRVGKSIYIIPITSIKESFKVQESTVIRDEANNSEMIMIRGDCCPVLRLHEFFKVKPDTTNLEEGIIVVVENESTVMCLFADELMGVQQVVVKALPRYIKKVNGISGCTVMGNGSVSLIIDVSGLINSS